MFENYVSDPLILKYNGQIPRYTSYPTAPHFTSEINSNVYSNWLGSLPSENTLSLYIHIPFCQQLCWYCGCYTKITKREAPIQDYIDTLIREIGIVADLLSQKNHTVSHIHFGGGSPTILSPELFKTLLKTIRSKFVIADDAEIAIEIDPRTLNEEKIMAYATSGVNRVSIGVQDFNLDVQRAINREQSFELVQQCTDLFKANGINNISLDLIYGLPKQTVEKIEKNIDAALLLNPNRISLFAYAHVRWMKKHMQLIKEEDLPDNASRLLMYRAAAERLNKNGYVSIGLDHFAKQNDSMAIALENKTLKRNFQGYSTDTAENIIGFGLSAISHLQFGYAQNTLDMTQYKKEIINNKLPIIKGFKTTIEDKIRKKIIDDIMCYMKVDLNAVCNAFSYPTDYFKQELLCLKELEKDGLVSIKNNVITIHPQARQLTRVVSSVFDNYYKPSSQKHSKIT